MVLIDGNAVGLAASSLSGSVGVLGVRHLEGLRK